MSIPGPRVEAEADIRAAAEAILTRSRAEKRVRRSVGSWGKVRIDRLLPFVCVHRQPPGRKDPGTRQLITGVASYVTDSGGRRAPRNVLVLVRTLCEGLAHDFGNALLIELWAAPGVPAEEHENLVRVWTPPGGDLVAADAIEAALTRAALPTKLRIRVESSMRARIAPPGLAPLLPAGTAAGLERVQVLGVEVPAIYLDGSTGTVYPVIHGALRRVLVRAIHRAAFRFARRHTTHRPAHFHELGPRSLTKVAWDIDERMASVSDGFDFLLLTTPRNTEQAWNSFRRSRYQQEPLFSYRPRPFDVSQVKRQLYALPLERIEDPTIAELFREQQDEIDRKLTMIADRGTPRFVLESQQLFGAVEDSLFEQALEILDSVSARSRDAGGRRVGAQEFAQRARVEVEHLREQCPGAQAQVEIRDDVSGLMVSRGKLLVGADISVPEGRVEALLQHEVGTHVLTYYNGLQQPFRQLRGGLPAYEELQEGLAVLAEHLVGGLTRPRLRLLAARVVATRHMLTGASFVEVFRELDQRWGLAKRPAFTTTMRVFRGGGHTKDAVYLRGLRRLLDYLREGRSLEPLFIGKIGLQHIALVEELTYRRVLRPPALQPRYLDRPEVQQRLARLREGLELAQLVASSPPRKDRRHS